MQLTAPDDAVSMTWLWILYLETSSFGQNKAFKSQAGEETWGRQEKVSLLLLKSHFWFSSEDTPNHPRPPLTPASQGPADHYSLRGMTLEAGQCSLKAT